MPESNLIYLNGHLLPAAYARISPLDYGFMYGYSLFETLRNYAGKLFRFPEHISRLRRGAEFMHISKIPGDMEIENGIKQVLQGNKLYDARIRVTLSAGEGNLSADASSCGTPTLLIAASTYSAPPEIVYEAGYRAIVSDYRRDSASPLCRVKSGNFLPNMLSAEGAKQSGANIAILLNEKGNLSECSTANIFIVNNTALVTPDEDSGILPGITRREVLDIANDIGLRVEQRSVREEELYSANEVFTTSSLIEIMSVTRIGGRAVGKGTRGEVTKQIHSAYKQRVIAEAC